MNVEHAAFDRLKDLGRLPNDHDYCQQKATENFYSRFLKRELSISGDLSRGIQKANAGGGEVGKIDWTLPGFAANGAVLLAAEGGSGKTSLIYRACDAIQEGSFFLDQVQAKKGNVLVIQGDEPQSASEAKFRRMDLKANFEILYAEPPLNMQWLKDTISSCLYTAVALDSATSLLTRERQELSDESFVRLLYDLNKCLVDNNVLGLIASHLNKPFDGQSRKIVSVNDISGRAAIAAAVTDMWGLWRSSVPKWEQHFTLQCLGKRNCRQGECWELQGNVEDYWWTIKEVSDGIMPIERNTLNMKISSFLASIETPVEVAEIAAAVETSYEVARRICSDMYGNSEIRRKPSNPSGRGRPTYLYFSNLYPPSTD